METFLKSLRTFYLFASIPPLAFFALFYFAAGDCLVSPKVSYILLLVLYGLSFLGIIVTSTYLRRTAARCENMVEEDREKSFGLAYKIRIILLNTLSFMSGIIYFITVVDGCVYMVGIMTIIILLSYPSKQYILRDSE